MRPTGASHEIEEANQQIECSGKQQQLKYFGLFSEPFGHQATDNFKSNWVFALCGLLAPCHCFWEFVAFVAKTLRCRVHAVGRNCTPQPTRSGRIPRLVGGPQRHPTIDQFSSNWCVSELTTPHPPPHPISTLWCKVLLLSAGCKFQVRRQFHDHLIAFASLKRRLLFNPPTPCCNVWSSPLS